ncbi:MAG: hypothetical protein L0216_04375 [Planctomycetales bacterium]|nr:hypothetical protein [Planctomycetales bacterium]
MRGISGNRGDGGRWDRVSGWVRRVARGLFGTAGAALLAAWLSFGCINPIPRPPDPAPPAGEPEITFGWFGAFIMDPSPGADVAAAMVFDGQFLYLGGSDEATGPGDAEWRLEKRSSTDGIKDEGFGTAGVVTTNPGPGPDSVTALALESGTGTFVFVVGYDTSPGDRQWRIEKRRHCDGTLDTAFGTGGVVVSNPSPGADEPTGVLSVGGDLYVVGFDESPGLGDSQWRIEKRSATTGALAAGFGWGGVVTGNPSAGADVPRAVSPGGTTGTFLVAGTDDMPGDREWRLERRGLGDGALDGTFGVGGVILANPSAGADELPAMFVDTWGIYLAGSDASAGPGDARWRVERRTLATGALDPWFGAGGVLVSNPTAGADLATSLSVWGSLLWVGGTEAGPTPATLADRQWRVERYQSGTRDTSFGVSGVLTVNPTPGEDFLPAILVTAPWIAPPPPRSSSPPAFDPLYLFGTEDSSGNLRWRIESRYP